MRKILSLATIATFLLSGAAHAATLDISLGLTPGSVSYSTGASFAQNINLANPGLNSLALGINSLLLPNGAENDTYFKPPLGVTGEYLAVTQNLTTPHTGSSVFTLNSGTEFGFTWGTIDTYNTLTITDSRNDVYVITGSDIAQNPPLSAAILAALYPGGFTYGTTQAQVLINDPYGSIVTAQFQSSTNSFEAGGFYVSAHGPAATPLPPALPLFAAGLLALTGFGYWRRRAASKA